MGALPSRRQTAAKWPKAINGRAVNEQDTINKTRTRQRVTTRKYIIYNVYILCLVNYQMSHHIIS